MERKIKEVEVIVTVEITMAYSGGELDDLVSADALPGSPEDLAEFKSSMAADMKNDIESLFGADHVLVTNVQYFEKDDGLGDTFTLTDGEEDSGEVNNG